MSFFGERALVGLLKLENVEKAFPILPDGKIGSSYEDATPLFVDTSIEIVGKESSIDLLREVKKLKKFPCCGWVHTHPSGSGWFSNADEVFFRTVKHKYPIFGLAVPSKSKREDFVIVRLLYTDCKKFAGEEIRYFNKLPPNTHVYIPFGVYRIAPAKKCIRKIK